MARAPQPLRQVAQPPGGVVFAVALLWRRRPSGVEQQVAILRHEQEQQPVDQSAAVGDSNPVWSARRSCSLSRRSMLCGCAKKPAPRRVDRHLHAVAQLVQRARTLLLGGLASTFRARHSFGAFAFHPRLVAQQPQQHEIGVDLAVHHGFEVELDIGLPRQADVVAQDAQLQPIGEEAPQVLVASG